jgi:hypothetical protein
MLDTGIAARHIEITNYIAHKPLPTALDYEENHVLLERNYITTIKYLMFMFISNTHQSHFLTQICFIKRRKRIG